MINIRDTAVTRYKCPTCGAGKGTPCTQAGTVHAVRLHLASGDADVVNACAYAMMHTNTRSSRAN